jgi:hypothetical protein
VVIICPVARTRGHAQAALTRTDRRRFLVLVFLTLAIAIAAGWWLLSKDGGIQDGLPAPHKGLTISRLMAERIR